jgi:peptide/nickel transport system substrate-binding protein
MRRFSMAHRLVSTALALGVVMGTMMVLAPSSGASSSSSKAVTWAEQPTTTPNFIFPFYPGSDCSVANVDQFQYLLYRPLYTYGVGSAFEVNPELSVANQPVYSNNDMTVTLTLKNWKWSDGETVTAQDVLFFMNIYHAQPTQFCGYVPGNMPDDVTNVTANGQTVTFTLKSSVNNYWWLYNELSQITPLPLAWDITAAGQAAGTGGCSKAAYGTDDAGCTAVYNYLANEAGYNPNNPSATNNNALSSYATNPLWAIVDGPWTLSSYNVDGQASFVPNKKYSGPVKATISKFTEIPYTTDTSEFNALAGGNLTVGYLPLTDVSGAAPAPPAAGPNNPRLSSNFNLSPLYLWQINYWTYNYNSTGDGGYAGKIFSQLYFRQAMQHLVDQPLYVKKLYKGYAIPTYGPVPTYPVNAYSTKFEKEDPLAYSPATAKELLSSHGWKVVAGGTDTCTDPGTASNQCGAGIPAGTPLNFQMQYATGITAFTNMVTAMRSSWSSVGINVTLTGESFNTVISSATACASCAWQMLNWGGGWTFSPDGYPSGDTLFGNGSAANYGSYGPTVDGFSTNQSLITASISQDVSLADWENYVAKQVPDGWQPAYSPSLTEIQKGLSGVTPQNPLWVLQPEQWRWSS